MNSKKKHYPEGAKIKKPVLVVILLAAAAIFAVPLLITIVKKCIDIVTGDKETMLSTIKLLGQGFGFSFGIFFFTIIFSLPLGLIVAAGKMSKIKTISAFIKVYVSVLRGTPLMLQLLLVYFGPYYLFGISTGNIEIGPFNYRFIASIIGFSLNYAAYFAEIFRGGIQSMPKGQYEAAQVLGFTYFKIILPQVVKRVLPSVGNEVITLVKDTSLAQVLAVTEMFTQASALASAQVSVMPFIVAGLFYYLMNFIIETLLGFLEKSMNYYS